MQNLRVVACSPGQTEPVALHDANVLSVDGPSGDLRLKLWRAYGLSAAPEAERTDFIWVQQEVDFRVNHMASESEKGFLGSGFRAVCEWGGYGC